MAFRNSVKPFLSKFFSKNYSRLKAGVEQYSILADLTDSTKENISFGQCVTGATLLLSYCTQYSHILYIVNGGFMIKMIFNTIKPILKERHKQRVSFPLKLKLLKKNRSIFAIVMEMKHIIF